MQTKAKILIVEDDPVQTALITESLGEEKYQFSNIPDGREALEFLLTTNELPDLILMDYHLPTIDGLSILTELRKNNRKLNIIFLTADYSIDTAIKSVNAGALEFIPKDARFLLNIDTIVQKAYQSTMAERERLVFEQALKESESRFKTVIEASKDGVFEWNIATGIAYASANNAYMLGYENKQFPKTYNGFINLVHPDDLPKLINSLMEHSATGSSFYESEVRLKCNNGEYKWVLERGIEVEKDVNGNPLRVIGVHSDITERKAAQEKLVEANTRLTTLIGNLPGIVYRCKMAYPIVKDFIGGRIFEITGYAPDELMGLDSQSCFFLIHPDDSIKAYEILNKAIELKTGYEHYYRIICKNKEIKWVWDHGKVIVNADTGNCFIEGYIVDVTEKILNEKALKQSEEEKNTILDNSMHAFILLSPNGFIIDFNRVANHRTIILSGKTLKKNEPVFNFLPEKELGQFTTHFKKVIKGEPAYWEESFEQRGNISWFENVLVPVLISRNDIKYLCYTSTDITERKQAEGKTLASEKLYNTTINSLNEILLVVDENMTILLANAATLRFVNSQKNIAQVSGKKIADVFPFIRKSILENFNKVFYSNAEVFFDEVFNINNRDIVVEIKISPVVFNGKVVRAVVLVRDITERKNIEKRIMNAIIETEERERKRFSEDLHDEMGSILSALKIYTNTLVAKDVPDERKHELVSLTNQLIDQAIQTAKEIANNLSPNVIKRFGLMSALYSLCDKLQASSGFSINLNASNYWHSLNEDQEISIYRIMAELINNSIKHSGGNQIDIDFSSTAQNLSITFKDNGNGFDFKNVLSENKTGLGLQNIQSRLSSLNGVYSILDSEQSGFRLSIELKIPAQRI